MRETTLQPGRNCRSNGRGALALVLLAHLLLGPGLRIGRAESDGPTESEVKAAMIYNFAQLVEWPQADDKSSQAPFVIGVFGEDPIETVLEVTLKGESFQHRAVQVRQMTTLSDARNCEILFVSQSQQKRILDLLEALRGSPTLTIGDTEDFVPLGGMIAFKKEGNKLRFLINPDAAMRAGLKISSKLLRLAIVQTDAAGKARS